MKGLIPYKVSPTLFSSEGTSASYFLIKKKKIDALPLPPFPYLPLIERSSNLLFLYLSYAYRRSILTYGFRLKENKRP